MNVIEPQDTGLIVFQPQEVIDGDEPTLPPGPRSEATIEDLHRELETATQSDWMRVLVGAIGDATRRSK